MTAEGGAGLVSARDFVYGSKSEVDRIIFWEDDDDGDEDVMGWGSYWWWKLWWR